MLLLGEQLSAAPPDVFDDYFGQDVKVKLDFYIYFVTFVTSLVTMLRRITIMVTLMF